MSNNSEPPRSIPALNFRLIDRARYVLIFHALCVEPPERVVRLGGPNGTMFDGVIAGRDQLFTDGGLRPANPLRYFAERQTVGMGAQQCCDLAVGPSTVAAHSARAVLSLSAAAMPAPAADSIS